VIARQEEPYMPYTGEYPPIDLPFFPNLDPLYEKDAGNVMLAGCCALMQWADELP